MVAEKTEKQPIVMRDLDPAAVADIIGMNVLPARRLMPMPVEQGGIPSSNFAVSPKSKRQFWRTSKEDILEWQRRRQAGAKPKARKPAKAGSFNVLTGQSEEAQTLSVSTRQNGWAAIKSSLNRQPQKVLFSCAKSTDAAIH